MVIDTSKLTAGSWKTTVAGVVTLACGFVLTPAGATVFAKWPWVSALANYLLFAGIGGGMLAAKDSNITGGTKLNTSNDPAVTKAAIVEKEP